MTATAARAAHAAPPGRRVAALEQRLARSTAATMDAMRSHEKCAEERDQVDGGTEVVRRTDQVHPIYNPRKSETMRNIG